MPLPLQHTCRRFAERIDDGFQRRRMSAAERARNVILTGFPRSGTSLFSTLINSLENVTCLNEISPTPYHHHFFGRVRRRIERGRPIRNQYGVGGELTTNTRDSAVQTEDRVAEAQGPNFLLAQKYTLPYLNRLEQFCAEGWPVWVLVRDPRFALRSWRECPPHWGISRLNPADELLAHIPFSSANADDRRVEVWNHYARRIDALRDQLQIVRYEDLVEDPAGQLLRFCEVHGLPAPAAAAVDLKSRNQPASYADESEALHRLANEGCELGLFGYA